MRAAVFYGARDIRVEDLADPVPGEGEVVVRVRRCGICGSDVEAYQAGLYEAGIVVGHEFSGEIVETGPGVDGWRVGDRVTMNGFIPCGSCYYCQRNRRSLCENVEMTGITLPGAMAEYIKGPAVALHRLPDNLSWERGAFVDPLANALHAVRMSALEPGDTALVMGAGPLGLLILQAALCAGAREVYVSEIGVARSRAAALVGAGAVINPAEENIFYRVDDLTRGQGVDVAFCCAGAPAVMEEALTLVRKGGEIFVMGLCEQPVQADFLTLVMSELSIKGGYGNYDEYDHAIHLLEREKVRVDALVTHRIGLERVVVEGFEVLSTPGSDAVKVLVAPGEGGRAG